MKQVSLNLNFDQVRYLSPLLLIGTFFIFFTAWSFYSKPYSTLQDLVIRILKLNFPNNFYSTHAQLYNVKSQAEFTFDQNDVRRMKLIDGNAFLFCWRHGKLVFDL